MLANQSPICIANSDTPHPLVSRRRGNLVCENVVILGDVEGAGQPELLSWPHWALKNLYAHVGIMFGKFWAGEQDTDRHGRDIPPPPFSFLSVRPAVRPVDPRFLDSTPNLAQAVAAGADDGCDVFESEGIPRDWKAVRSWASSQLPGQ